MSQAADIPAHRSSPDVSRGVFETLLVRHGRPVELDAHLERLGASVEALYGARVPAGAEALVRDRARGLRLGRLRLTVAPTGGGQLGADTRVANVADEVVFPDREVALAPAVVEGGLGPHKWADRDLLERLEADAGDAVPLLVDGDGSVLEASRANVFAVEGGAVLTPPADGRILPGVTRARVIALAGAREEPLTLDRLLAAGEVFLTGAVRGVEPVRDGAVTRRVAAALQRHWETDR